MDFGFLGSSYPADECSSAHARDQFAVNLLGLIWCCQNGVTNLLRLGGRVSNTLLWKLSSRLHQECKMADIFYVIFVQYNREIGNALSIFVYVNKHRNMRRFYNKHREDDKSKCIFQSMCADVQCDSVFEHMIQTPLAHLWTGNRLVTYLNISIRALFWMSVEWYDYIVNTDALMFYWDNWSFNNMLPELGFIQWLSCERSKQSLLLS